MTIARQAQDDGSLIPKDACPLFLSLDEFEARKQALSRFLIGAVILSDPVLDVIRRELRRVSQLNKASADVKIDTEQIEQVLQDEVIKREVVEGPKADEAARKVAKAAGKMLKKASVKEETSAAAGGATGDSPTSAQASTSPAE